MSVWATTWAWQQPITSSGRKFVLLALADFANEVGFCYPSQETLSVMTGIKERTVRQHIKGLEEDGYIKREHRRQGAGKWTSDGFWLQAPPEDLGPKRPVAESASGNSRQRQKTAQPAADSAREPLREPLTTTTTKSAGEEFDETSIRCAEILRETKGISPRREGLEEFVQGLREEYPKVNAVETCKDFQVYHLEQGPSVKPLLRLRNFFKNAKAHMDRNANRDTSQSSSSPHRGGQRNAAASVGAITREELLDPNTYLNDKGF